MIGWSGLPRQCEAFDSRSSLQGKKAAAAALSGDTTVEGARCPATAAVEFESERRAVLPCVRVRLEFVREKGAGMRCGSAVTTGPRTSCEFLVGLVGLFVCWAKWAVWWGSD